MSHAPATYICARCGDTYLCRDCLSNFCSTTFVHECRSPKAATKVASLLRTFIHGSLKPATLVAPFLGIDLGLLKAAIKDAAHAPPQAATKVARLGVLCKPLVVNPPFQGPMGRSNFSVEIQSSQLPFKGCSSYTLRYLQIVFHQNSHCLGDFVKSHFWVYDLETPLSRS